MKFSDLFAQNIRKVREELDLSQEDLAERLKIGQSTVSMWEAGNRTPKLNEINRIASVLNITVARLLGHGREPRLEITRNEIYVDGAKVGELESSDIDKVLAYIKQIKSLKGKHPQAPPPNMPPRAKKILIIDDEQEICEMLYTFLVPHNYKVFLAFNGQMGLEYFDEVRPNIVLLDLKMPDMDGPDVLKIIRKVSDVPVIVITGHPQDVSEIHLSGLKIEGYIEKPIHLSDVLNTLKHVIGE